MSYDPTFSASPWRDTLRCLLQETVDDEVTLRDSEMDGFRLLFGDTEGAAKCAEALAMKFNREPQRVVDARGGTAVSWVNRANEFRELAESIRAKGFDIVAGGVLGSGVSAARSGVAKPSREDTCLRQRFI